MRTLIRNIYHQYKAGLPKKKIKTYFRNGRVPWSVGYEDYKFAFINETINSDEKLRFFKNKELPVDFGVGLDERVVEYPWIFSKIAAVASATLDAGSTFNFDFIVEHPLIKKKELTIYTFYPEYNCFFNNRINYVYGDLRKMYFKDNCFEEIVSQSTIEHIDMNNSIYGYEGDVSNEKSYEYLIAVKEMVRILKPGGKLLLTFPFGKYENHGFFQQFDREMVQKILDLFTGAGITTMDLFKYEKSGWRFAHMDELAEVTSYNPHTGKGKSDDGAAHCRSISCIEFIKNS